MTRFAKTTMLGFAVICTVIVPLNSELFGQDDQYLMGLNQQLEMIVHIIGEVKRPGEYRVSDKTSIIALLSKAGGPNQFSKLSSVTISRIHHGVATNGDSGHLRKGNTIMIINLNDYLKNQNAVLPPRLKPGDVVLVPRNTWSRWRSTFSVIRDISVVLSLYLLYLRVQK